MSLSPRIFFFSASKLEKFKRAPYFRKLVNINDSANASHVLSGSLLDLSSSFCINYHLPQSITTNSTSPDLIAFDSPPPPSRTLTTFPQSNGLASNVLNLNGNTSTILQGQTSFINSLEATNIFDEVLACSSQHTNLVSISASHSQFSPSILTNFKEYLWQFREDFPV
ncbi:unnamed protein product [Didymodactylos carnosus]|uniref:Uncharacterized protein n=1 Tax=Didymodactylos carnosus TaxID=1234261 RepID=A0A815ZLQ8_9BILA|nr:unnamed protein product [Didymodactylos carnosus]CAF4454011.1 unnamed protein product [Didymodactylos carnosus]